MDFALLLEDFTTTQELCLNQQALYKEPHEGLGHKDWRKNTADERTQMLFATIPPFLGTCIDADAQHWLGELYVKGYCIGIRLRPNAVKWQIFFPVVGMQICLDRIMNRTLNLAGDPMTTQRKLASNASE